MPLDEMPDYSTCEAHNLEDCDCGDDPLGGDGDDD